MSVLGKKIIYYDLAISPGLGMLSYEQQLQTMGNKSQTSMAFTLDVTQYFFIKKNWAIRVDLKNKWFDEEVLKYSGSGVEGDKLRDDLTNTTAEGNP